MAEPSKKALIARANKLAEALGVDAPETDGLETEDLKALVSDLAGRVEKAEAEAKEAEAAEKTRAAEIAAKAEADAKAKAEAEAAAGDFDYWVPPGRAVLCKVGNLGPGKELRPEFFPNGQKDLDALVAAGKACKAK